MEFSSGSEWKAAHRFFSADCFNKAWQLIEKQNRTAQEDERKLQLSMASLWHWTQRDDCAAKNLSIGYWQLSRVYSVLGQAANAERYGRLCLSVSPASDPFLAGYAYEALARAAATASDTPKAQEYLKKAEDLALQISDAEDKEYLLKDLASLRKQ